MAMHLHCSREGCQEHQDTDEAMERSPWLVLHRWDDEGGVLHFCGTTCLLASVARFEVPETVPHD
jgi:hypothetical protein